MGDNFENKGYGDYFKALEQQLNNAEPKPAAETAEPQQKSSSQKRRGIYKVLRLRKSVLAVFAAAVVLITAITVAGISSSTDSEPDNKGTQSKPAEEKQEKVPKFDYVFSADTPDILADNDAQCAIVINKTDNTVVAARNAHQRAYPASTTKIMTLLVAAENIKDLNDTFTMTYAITDPLYLQEASVAGFLNNETVPLIDMLYGAILPSGADASVGLAIKISGSEEAFVELMNQKVKELGLKNTHFTNVVGLHNENNYSSAYDMAVIIDAAMQNELCRKILSTYQYTTTKTEQNPEGILLSSTLFSYMYGNEPETATILGGKTGYVNQSGYCIATFGESNQSGDEYIAVTLGNSSLWPAMHGQIALYKELAK